MPVPTPLSRPLSRPASRVGRLAAAVVAAALVPGLLAPVAAAETVSPAPAPSDPQVQSALTELAQAPTGQDLAEQDAARAALAEQTGDDFYTPPAVVPGEPGTLIRQEPSVFYLDPVKLVRMPASATRVMYSSQDAQGDPVAVTGTVLTPTAPWKGKGERPVVAYAVGTQGLGDQCAPSRSLSTGMQYEGIGITGLLNAGYTVVATDYEGLGTPGAHTYMVREAQAHAVLDSVRAAQEVGAADVSATSPVVLVGYSQGGGASAAAAELAPDYAPELDLKAAYAGAPPADLVPVADRLERSLYSEFLLFAIAGQLTAYDVDPDQYLNAAGMQDMAEAAENCVTDLGEHAFLDSSRITDSGTSLPTLVRTDPTLAGILAEQRIGAQGRAPEVPVMIAHSLTDDVIPYSVGRDLGRRWCAAGTRVRFDPMATPTHLGGYLASQPRTLQYLDATLDGRWTVDSCGWF